MPGLDAELEPRFDLSVNGAPAGQVFMSIVAGTRYSVLLHPGVGGAISLNLNDVTVAEALSAIRELYGYDYRVDGTRIFVQPAGMQTRVFQVNYLPGQRRGQSDTRVTSQQQSDFWADLRVALVAIVGAAEGRSVIITPQSGVVVVRALPHELRAVEQYLRATRLSMERQVMLEAKIIDVTLSADYQAGINWALFNKHT